MSTPTIYVACLAAYTSGILHGEWIDATDLEQMHRDIENMLKSSPVPDAEEIAIHDSDNFYDVVIGEYANLEHVAKLATLIAEHGQPFADYYYEGGMDLDEAAGTFEEAYMGRFESLEDFAMQQFEELYGPINLPGFRIEVDHAAWACDYWISDAGDVFQNL